MRFLECEKLIYITWQLGVVSNQHRLIYSAASQWMGIIKDMLNNISALKIKYQYIKSLIKI